MNINNLLSQGFNPQPAGMRMNALQQVQQMQDGQQRNALMQQQMQDAHAQRQLQIAEAQRVALQAQQQRQQQLSYLDSVSPANGPARPVDPAQAMMAGFKPEQIAALQGPKPASLMNVAPGGNVFDPTTRKPVFTAPFKPEAQRLPPLGELQAYRDALPQGDPKRREVDALIANQTRPPKYAGGGGGGGGAPGGKVPAGYRWKDDGTMEPIPGGPADKKTADKVLPQAIVKSVTEARDNALTIDALQASFKPAFAGKGVLGMGADMQMTASGNIGADKDAVEWWKNYRKQAELIERHALFGAALTPTEQASWRSSDIGPGMNADVVARNLSTRKTMTQKILERARQDSIDAGHSETRVNAIASRKDADPAAVAVKNDTDYNSLPAGTRFVTPDGKTGTKR